MAQQFGAAFVFGLSRISRNVSVFARVVGALYEAGRTIYDAATGTAYEPEDVTARFTLSALDVLPEHDAERIYRERRTRRALTR